MGGVVASATTYQYCENCNITGTSQNVTVSLVDYTPCYVTQDGYQGSVYYYEEKTQFKLTIPSAIDCDLTVYINQNVVGLVTGAGGYSIDENYQGTYTIPAGQTGTSVQTVLCYSYLEETQFTEEFTYTWTLKAQQNIPSCAQDNDCTIAITGSTTTSPSLLGASDGSITVFISGATGSSYTFRLNGGTPQGSNTFTNLPAGTYQVRVDEGDCFDSVEIVLPEGAFTTGAFNVSEPSSILASENPIVLSLSTAIYDNQALPSETKFTFASGITNNYSIQFTLNSPFSYTKTFTAKGFPNKVEWFLASTLTDRNNNYVKDNTTSEQADSFAQALADDIVFSSAYYINASGNTVTLVAKAASSRFDITDSNITRRNSSGSIVTTGITLTQVQAGTNFYEGDILENYNVYAELWAAETNLQYGSTLTQTQFNRETDVILPYQKSNFMKFDFSEICKSFVSTPKPDYEFTGFTTITTYMQPFFAKYGEQYPLIANTNTQKKRLKGTTDYFWVCNAALDWETANDMSDYTGITSGGTLSNVPFLTNSPSRKQCTKAGRELLYFIVPQNLGQGNIDVRGDITFWDGSTLSDQTLITIATGSSVNFGGAFCINTSFEVLGLDNIETSYDKLIKKVDIAVYTSGGTNQLTETKTYLFELEERNNRVGISFLNKLGTFDSFDFTGIEENTIDRSSSKLTYSRDYNFDGSLNKGFKYNGEYDVKVTKKLSVNSGWINETTFDWLLELMSSNEIYVYSNENDNFVTVTGFEYQKNSNDNLFNIELELIQTIYENNISI